MVFRLEWIMGFSLRIDGETSNDIADRRYPNNGFDNADLTAFSKRSFLREIQRSRAYYTGVKWVHGWTTVGSV